MIPDISFPNLRNQLIGMGGVSPMWNPGNTGIGGTYSSGASQIGAGNGMNTNFGTQWNNNELQGMTHNMARLNMNYGGG